MALLKLGAGVDAISGKIGGQSVSITRNGTTIRNIAQPRIQPSKKQSIQRFRTAALTNRWQQLTPLQRSGWDAASIDYDYIDKFGKVATRNGFQTYCFLNQNLELIDQAKLNNAPTFTAVNTPTISDISTDNKEFVVQGSSLQLNTEYVIYAQIHYSDGAISFTPIPIKLGLISRAQLLAGFDVVSLVPSEFSTLGRSYSLTIEIVTINNDTGNRDLDPPRLTKLIAGLGLQLTISSYYPWDTDFLDHFGNVNPTDTGTSVLSSGFVSGGVTVGTAATDNILFPYNTFWDFNEPVVNSPKSICFWVKKSSTVACDYFANRVALGNNRPAQFRFTDRFGQIATQLFFAFSAPRRAYRTSTVLASGTWYFVAMGFTDPDNSYILLDSTLVDTPIVIGTMSQVSAATHEWVLNGEYNNTAGKAPMQISELTYFNQYVNPTTMEVIRQANLAGQTILDIN